MAKRPGGEKRGNSKDRRARKLALLARHGNGTSCPCSYCGTTLTYETLEADRIIEGGSYRRNNVIPACRKCNVARLDKPFSVFLRVCEKPFLAETAKKLAQSA